jgi:hypothetical protein
MAQEFPIPRSRLYVDPYEVEVQLRQLDGLTSILLKEAVRVGDQTRRNIGPHEIAGSPAYNAVSKTLEFLRIELIPFGWHDGLHFQIPVAFNNDHSIAVTVTEGDENTGIITNKDPRTVAPKGLNTSRAIDESRLFQDAPVAIWYLLAQSTEEGLYAELSSPLVHENGAIIRWDERIILGRIDGPDGGELITPNSSTPPNEQAVVNVVRKQA